MSFANSHIANIVSKDSDLSYDGLQRAVSNLSRLYSDTLSLSTRAGSAEPCLLPLTANITDFPIVESESSLSSFHSSLVNSFQSSLTPGEGIEIKEEKNVNISTLLGWWGGAEMDGVGGGHFSHFYVFFP